MLYIEFQISHTLKNISKLISNCLALDYFLKMNSSHNDKKRTKDFLPANKSLSPGKKNALPKPQEIPFFTNCYSIKAPIKKVKGQDVAFLLE